MDAELVERARRGDRDAFRMLAGPLADRLYAVAVRVLRDPDLAADATQQALVTVWRDLPTLRELDRFEAWSYRVGLRACYAERRNERRWSPAAGRRLLDDTDATGSADGFGAMLDRDQLERAARRLSMDHRAVLVLHYFVDLSVGDIADMLDIPAGTVRSRLRYAMRALRASIAADERPVPREAVQ
jgi:RNA polymerase sigma-70 factor (ECF subfamily)